MSTLPDFPLLSSSGFTCSFLRDAHGLLNALAAPCTFLFLTSSFAYRHDGIGCSAFTAPAGTLHLG